MISLNNASIKDKLKFLISMSILLMLLIAGSVLTINTILSNKEALQHELITLTKVTSLAITPALIFDNNSDAKQTLTTLKAHQNIVYAAVIKNKQQKPFAVYSAEGEWSIPKDLITSCKNNSFSLRFMQVCKPLIFDQIDYGRIVLVISLDDVYQRLFKEMGTALLALGFAALLIFWFLEKIAKKLSDPILELVSISEEVKQSGDYQQRANINSTDEIGQLGTAFNSMLEQIDSRNKALERQKDTLEEQVQKRTYDLQKKTNEAYQLADKAEAASKAKSEFLATMSHEIRTPMNGVLGMTELILNTPLNDRQQRLANTAYHSAESLLGIINNILDFSKIESGKFQLIINDFDIRPLLEDTVEMMASQAHSKGLELILNIPPELNGTVRADAERLRQIFVNLLGNAIKFTQQGEVQLKVSCIDEDCSDTHISLLFEVCDTGPGIAAEQQELIFESFTQADGSITRRHGGTGLGLSISRQLLEMMGGELKLKSILGQGSCFSFSLYLEHSDYQSIAQKADMSSLQNIRILIVDDNATNREILSSQLDHWGINYYCVANGPQAIHHLLDAKQQGEPYQIALLDWHMPEMDGLSLAKILHDDPQLQPLSLVMLSSDSVTFDQEEGESHGISFFLNKPVIQDKLLNCLLELTGIIQSQQKPVSPQTGQLSGHILLAEDNLVNQEVGMAILRSIGCQPEVVNNGMEAAKASAIKHYDAILMDCHMPIMDGFQATAEIRERETTLDKQSHVPIIALTADVQKGIVEQCKDAGMDEYISKPFNKKQLQDVLAKWLPIRQEAEKNSVAQTHTDIKSTYFALNASALDNLRQHTTENGESLLNKAITLFLDSAPKEVDALQKAFNHLDCNALSGIAHSFKSSCANLGLQSLADCAASIEARSKQGDTQGIDRLLTTIQLDLPNAITALNKELNTTEIAHPPQPVIQVKAGNIQNKRILIVDDDLSFRLITSSVLTASSFIVDEASNGIQAQEKIQQHKPSLVILDAIMDQMDGFEVCRLLRENPDMADVPIIMSTGLGDTDSINRAFESGATDFIVKPINYPILIHRLSFILRASQDAAELRNSKLQLTAAQRIARLGYWRWDVKQNHFQLSEQLADLCAVDLAGFETTLDGFIALIEPEDQPTVKDMILKAPYSSAVQHIEYRLQVMQAEPIFVHQEMVKVIENGQPMITGTVQDISQRKATEKKVHHLAYFDHLTGLASRTYYKEHIHTIIETASYRNEKFAFLFLDLDGFKDINDSLGHNLGDQLLKVIAQRIQGVIRDADFAARLGGDEFCMLLNDISCDDFVVEIANRCLRKINEPLFLDHQQIKPRVSIGIAIFPRDGCNEIELMKAADTAMYAAKQAGKQRYAFYSQDMALQAVSRLEKEQMLLDAFEKEQFFLHYQPQISMQTGRMVSMEALIRWQHPEKGMIPPNEFIPEIERLGLIVELGNWVINAACKQIMHWHKAGFPFLQVAVNLSALHFQDAGLLTTVQAILAKTGVPAEYLELEVTESAMQAEECIDFIKQLRLLGVKISIDDFGTGYSCLASLKQFPLDCLKIDKEFVDDVVTNPHTSLLLGAIIGLAKALDYTLVAEGVETKDQALVMHGLGCQIIQGYLFSRPVSSDKIPTLIEVDFSHLTK